MVIYFPGFIPALSLTLLLSSMKTLSSAKAGTSHHLKSSSKNWSRVGFLV